jgi:(4S)-4-hydroxy-5-phosphonooxypentane-2,3-dione isomerase
VESLVAIILPEDYRTVTDRMIIVHVFVEVIPDGIAAFRAATLANVAESRKEAGVISFDALGQEGTPTKFLLIEVYRDESGAAAHKRTPHYEAWRDAVAPLMAQPRYSVRYFDLTSEHAI